MSTTVHKLSRRASARYLFSLAALTAMISGTVWAAASQAAPVQRVGDPPKLVTFNLRKAKLPDALKELSRLAGVPFLTDAFSDDPVFSEIRVENVPVDVAITRVAELFDRELMAGDRILVLRHRKWIHKRRLPASYFPWTVEANGRGAIERASVPVPTFTYRFEVADIESGALIRRMNKLASSAHSFPAELARHRVSMIGERATAFQVMAGMEVLFNATTTLSLRQTDAQKKQETAALQAALETRTSDEGLSDELKQALGTLVTPAERAALAANQKVKVSLDRLPPDVRKKAEKYVQQQWSAVRSAVGEDQSLDFSRGVWLSIDPNPALLLGVHTHLMGGGAIGF